MKNSRLLVAVTIATVMFNLRCESSVCATPPSSATRTLPSGPFGETIRLGETPVEQTATHPLTKPHVGNALSCTSCHLKNWTDPKAATFIGAGLADTVQLASWLKVAMPLDETDLTDQEALDIATFVNKHDRPVFDVKNHLPMESKLGEYNAE